MRSKHNLYPEFGDQVVERWQKACIHPVAGTRLDPYDTTGKRLDFILISAEEDFNFDTRKLTFRYDNDIIELYSAREVTVFRALNQNAIESGLLVPYGNSRAQINTVNALTDEQVLEIAEMSNLLKFRKALAEITSINTLKRILDKVPESRAKAFDRSVMDRMTELEQK